MLGFVQFVVETVADFVFDVFTGRGFTLVGRDDQVLKTILAVLFSGLLGVIAGGLSCWVFAEPLIEDPLTGILSLIFMPIGLGLALGAWESRSLMQVRLDRFASGFIFALAFGLMRVA